MKIPIFINNDDVKLYLSFHKLLQIVITFVLFLYNITY